MGEGTSMTAGACPQCTAALVGELGFVRWCQACDWNAVPKTGLEYRHDSSKHSASDRWALAQADKAFEAVRTGTPSKPSAGGAGIALMLVSLLLLGVQVALVVAGVVVFLTSSSRAFSLIFTVPLVAAGLFPFAAVVRRDRRAVKAPRDRFPGLYGWTDELAGVVGVPPVRDIRFDPSWNAHVRRRPGGITLTLGMPLWVSLDERGRAAVVSHELAHLRNGDPTRGLLVGLAVGQLAEWAAALRAGRANRSVLTHLMAVPVEWLMRGIDRLARATSLRAEFYADHVGASAASTEAMVEGLTVTSTGNATADLVRQRLGKDGSRLFHELPAAFQSLPESERERRRRAAAADLRPAPDSTHPPIGRRIAALRAHPTSGDPRVSMARVPTDEALLEVQAELLQRASDGR